MELLAHQKEAVSFLTSRPGALLAYEQGLGKTAIAIASFDKLQKLGSVRKMLVICPNSLKGNWADEISKFAPHLTSTVITETGRTRRTALSRSLTDIVVINYEGARSEITAICALLKKHPYVLVLDESHNVKNQKSINALAARYFAPLVCHTWLLSGTPVTNSPSDIYSQIQLISSQNPLGSPEMFEINYGSRDAEAQEKLSNALRPYVLRKTKAECLTLPEKVFQDVFVELPEWQQSLYDSFKNDLVSEVKGMSEDAFSRFMPTALTRLVRLAQVASNPALLDSAEKRIPAKIQKLDELLESKAFDGEKVIIWSNYVKTIEMLHDRYSHLGADAIYGKTANKERQKIADRFQNDSSLKLLIANPAAAGTGFTFTAARYSIFETIGWRYDYFAQSQDRNHRIGQTRDVIYIRLLAKDTLDEAIIASLDRKEEMAKGILGDFPIALPTSKMSIEDFIRLVQENKIPNKVT